MVNFVSVFQFSESYRFLPLSCQNKPVYCNEGNKAAALEATGTLLVVRYQSESKLGGRGGGWRRKLGGPEIFRGVGGRS